MKNLRKHQLTAIGSSIAVLYGVLCLVAFASAASRTEKPAPVDAEQFADFMGHEVLDIQDLAEGAEVQRRMFNRITPPGLVWTQPMFPPVAPFDAQYFDDQFLDRLLGEDKNSVVIYPLSLIQDPKTRETLIYNAEGELIAAIPVDGTVREWPADADPSRVILQLDLLPAEDVEPYLYTERRIEESLARHNASRSAKSGGAATRGLEAGEFGFSDMQSLTSGNILLTVTNGADMAEIFAYTVWHTSSVSVVVWTNENDEVITSTNIHWHQVSPAFNGLESAWECLTTNLVLTNGAGVYEDANISSNARIRFYAVANRQDTDGDGLTDGAEIFVHHTNPQSIDTDGDGHSDGREIALGTDPLDDGDFFGIVINAALPIPPPPGSEVGREWVELFNVGQHAKSLAGFRLQTARPSGWTNVFTFPPGTVLDPGDFMVIGNGTNGDFQANLYLPNSSFTPAGLFGIRLVKPEPVFHVADALFYGFTNEYGFSLDGFGEQLPILRPRTNWVIRRTWVGYDTDHAGDWKNVSAALWIPHTQGNYLDLDGDGLSNAAEIAGGLFPLEGGTRIDEVDSDFDGLSDAAETALGTDPNNVDTDGDAFPWDANYPPCGNDADEVTSGTDPLDSDCDNDGIPDGWELAGGLNPLSPDSNGNGMPDGDEDSDGDGIPNAVEVDNLTNPFDADDVDPRPYLWLKNGDIANGAIDEDDIGYGTILTYHIKARTNCPPIMVRVIEGGHVIEKFSVSCTASYQWLNPDEFPCTNRVYCITPNGKTNFTFKIIDGLTTWENENPSEYGADIALFNAPAILDIHAGVPEASEESVGFLLADKSAHPDALRRPLSIAGPENTWGYASNIVLTYDTVRLRIYDLDGNVLDSGTQFYEGDYIPAMEVEGLTHSESMRDAWIEVEATGIPLSDRVTATILKADIGTVAPLANRTLHPDAAREPLLLKQTLPADWNGLMQLELTGAAAFWTPTGGMPIVLSETVFTNAQLPQTIYLEGDGCGMGEASFAVVGLSDCVTSIPLQIFGVNATLAGVAEADEESPGGFIADRTVHTNAPRTMLTLEACGPYGSPGNLILGWDSSAVNIYTAPSGGSALTQFVTPFHGFNGTNLYVEGVVPGASMLSWVYSEQTNCVDHICITVVKDEFQRDGDCSGFDDTLNPPWLMVPVNATNTALVLIYPANAADYVNFLSRDTGTATVAPLTADTSPEIVYLTGVSRGDTTIQSKLSSLNYECAALNVAVKARIDKTIAIHAITEENDDVQVIPLGQGQPNQTCITSGTNGILNSVTNGDDVVVGSTITTGPNGICETSASGDDVQVITVGKGKANATCVTKGANSFRDTIPAGDDVVTGDDIHTGADGVCNTMANAINLVPTTCPTAAQLQSYLNDTIWGRQANVYFTVIRSDHTLNFDLDRDGKLDDPYEGPPGTPKVPLQWDEVNAVRTVRDTSVDYNIFYVGSYEYPIGLTDSPDVFTQGTAPGCNSVENHTAHEVGHLLGIRYESLDMKDVMYQAGLPANPCRVVKRDWDTVNPP